jgi:cytochrome c-type biogenesis protein CcmH/NrfF
MIQNYPEIVIADGGLPPLAMRTEVTIQLFVAVIVIETIIIMLAAPRELRLKSLWLVPLVNLLSSCLLGPAQIANEDGSFFHPPIFLPAMAVWRDDFGFYEALLGLLLAFAIFVVLLGCLTVCVEGSLARLALLPSSKHLWKQIGLANAASYLFLYAWSCWLGYSLREKKTGNSSDAFIAQLTDSVGRRVSEKGAESLKTYAWLLFFLAAAVMLLLIGFGMYRTRQMERSEEPQFSFLLAYGSLIGGVWLNLGSIQLFVFLLIAGIYVLLISLPVVFLLLLSASMFKLLRRVKKKEEAKIHLEQEGT